MEPGPLVMVVVCLSDVFFCEAEQASLHLAIVEVRSGSCECQEVVAQ
jgi:hypothetical protein